MTSSTKPLDPITTESDEITYIIRPIQPDDNPLIAKVIRTVLEEHQFNKPGTAYYDPEVDTMYETYQGKGKAYWVIEDSQGTLVGGGGYSRLRGTRVDEGICELQKVYFYANIRGKGLGKQLLEKLIALATRDGYQEMYLESACTFDKAVSLYERLGFSHLNRHKGDTGHHEVCGIYMSRPLMPLFATAI